MDEIISEGKTLFTALKGKQLFQEETLAYKDAPNEKISIHPNEISSTIPQIQDFYTKLDDYITKNPFCVKGKFDIASLSIAKSGRHLNEKGILMLNTWSNRILEGYERNREKNLTISIVRLWKVPEEGKPGWILTYSWSIYSWLSEGSPL